VPTQFSWTSSSPPPLHRYTPHGRRHVCSTCGSVMTIVYDEDTGMIWPAAGTLDDDSLVESSSSVSSSSSISTTAATQAMSRLHLHSVLHICCKYRQRWYELPNDGNPRISDAS
jgi:hypothetical protein